MYINSVFFLIFQLGEYIAFPREDVSIILFVFYLVIQVYSMPSLNKPHAAFLG